MWSDPSPVPRSNVLLCHAVLCCCLFVPQDIKALFKQHVLYIVASDIGRDMALALGATCSTSADTVLQVLSAWSAQAADAAPSSSASEAAPSAGSSSAHAAAADGQDGSDSAGGFSSTLHDMGQIYHHLARFLSTRSELPPSGFNALLDPQRLAGLPKDVAARLLVCKAFSDTPLIWLPDTDALAAAAAAHRAAESRRAYLDEDAYGGGTGLGPGGGFGRGAMGRGAAAGRGRGGRGPAGKVAGRGPGALQSAGGKQGSVQDAEPVADGFMYDGALISALAHTRMRGRFYLPDQLRFTDDARIFEVTYPILQQHFNGAGGSSGSKAAGEAAGVARGSDAGRPPPMLRVLVPYYGPQRDVFVDLLQRFKYEKWIPLVGECRCYCCGVLAGAVWCERGPAGCRRPGSSLSARQL